MGARNATGQRQEFWGLPFPTTSPDRIEGGKGESGSDRSRMKLRSSDTGKEVQIEIRITGHAPTVKGFYGNRQEGSCPRWTMCLMRNVRHGARSCRLALVDQGGGRVYIIVYLPG